MAFRKLDRGSGRKGPPKKDDGGPPKQDNGQNKNFDYTA